jgi:patatin-like phospholipase/acyl hydrolase
MSYNGLMSPKKHKVRAVSISGGGIKGIIPAYMMMEMEKILQEVTGKPDEKIINYIDLFSGTSVGGILAALYLAPIDAAGNVRSAKDVYQKIIEAMKIIFYNSPSGHPMPAPDYSSPKSKEYFTDVFKNLELKDLLRPTLITAYEPNRHWMSFFRQQHAKVDPSANFLVSDMCLATAALPVYFDPVIINSFSDKTVTEHSFIGAIHPEKAELTELIAALKSTKILGDDGEILIELSRSNRADFDLPEKWHPFCKIIFSVLERVKNPAFTFVDGAIFANNPSLCTLVEVANMCFEQFDQNRSQVKDTILISLGTGVEEVSEPYSGKINPKFTTRLMNMLFGCAESLAHFECLHAFSASNVLNQYYNLDPIIKLQAGKTVPTANFYDTRQENIQALEDLAADYAEKNRPVLKNIVNDLLKEIQ